MAYMTVTNTLVNGNTADAGELNTNFSDVISATSDGTKDFNINALTCAGAVAFNGNTTLGNATSDTVTFTARVASSVLPSADDTYDLGSSSLQWRQLYADDITVNATTLVTDAANGRVGIGTSSPATPLDISINDSTNGTILRLTHSAGSTWSDDDPVASLEMYSSDASGPGVKAAIQALVDTSGGGNYINHSKLEFKTCRTNSLSTKMTIDSSGEVSIPGNIDLGGRFIVDIPVSTTSTEPSASGVSVISMNMAGGSISVVGFSGGVSGQIIHVIKTSSANTLTFVYNSGSAGSGNKILTKSGTDITISNYGVQSFMYAAGAWYEM
jgi:hypothetical protein